MSFKSVPSSPFPIVLGFLLLLVAGRGLWACDFIVLRAPDGLALRDLRADAEPSLDFLATQSAPPNNDGYGLVLYGQTTQLADSQRVHVVGNGTAWYQHNDGGALDSVRAALWRSGSDTRLLLGHSRNGSGGRGAHPFVQERAGHSLSFMHNGDLTDGTSRDMKEALLRGLNQCGYFQRTDVGGSNWEGDPADVDSWIDSELLFFYLLHQVDVAGGDVLQGLHAALNARDWYGFDVKSDLTAADSLHNPASVINFVFSDGAWNYVFRNSRAADPSHELGWALSPNGLVTVRTQEGADLHALAPYELLVIPPSGSPWTLPFLQEAVPRTQPVALDLLQAVPNPFNPATVLHFQLATPQTCTLRIFNVLGAQVATLHEGTLSAGLHAMRWDGLNEAGSQVSSGSYLAVLELAGQRSLCRLLLVR